MQNLAFCTDNINSLEVRGRPSITLGMLELAIFTAFGKRLTLTFRPIPPCKRNPPKATVAQWPPGKNLPLG